MEILLAVIIALLVLATIFLPWINAARFRSLRVELEELRFNTEQLQEKLTWLERAITSDNLEKEIKLPKRPAMPERQSSEEVVDDLDFFEEAVRISDQSKSSDFPKEEETRGTDKVRIQNSKRKSSIELNLGTKLPVWVGAISLILAVFFLVKYSIDSGWFGPGLRLVLGSTFGVSLLALGQWLFTKDYIANYIRISQALVGAGLVVLYVCIYAAVHLYGFLHPGAGFVCMVSVTIAAVVLSLRQGQPIAVFALIGGLITPALIGSDEPNAAALFSYLFLLTCGMIAIMASRQWWRLSAVVLIGVFLWVLIWGLTAFAAADSAILIVFVMAVCFVALTATRKHVVEEDSNSVDQKPVHVLNLIAIFGAVLTFIWLGSEISLGLFEWSMLGLLSLALIGLSYFQPKIYQKLIWIKLTYLLMLYAIWAGDVTLTSALMVLMWLGAIYIAVPNLLMRRVKDPRFWAGVQCVSAVFLYMISYSIFTLPVEFTDGFVRFWGILSLFLASLTIYQAREIRIKYKSDKTIQDHLVAIFALTASSFISLGIAIELPVEHMALAFSAQILATALIYKTTNIEFLKTIMYLLSIVFIVLSVEYISLFIDLILSSLEKEIGQFSGHITDVYTKLGGALLLIGLALYTVARHDKNSRKIINILFGISLALTLALSYSVLRSALNGFQGNIFELRAGFIERGFVSVLFTGCAIGLIKLLVRYDFTFLKKWGTVLFHICMFRVVYFDLLLYAPHTSSAQFVGGWPILNGVSFTYGAATLFSVWAVYSKNWQGLWLKYYKFLGFTMLFVLSSYTVRQLFHGADLHAGPTSSAEYYMYSVSWLITGSGLLFLGIQKNIKSVRMVSSVFLIITVTKVFLFDAAALEGLYRVFSFFGLGISLIALSYFYTKFVFKEELASVKS